ncbi:transposable element Tcb2 transposase [Trichonephila clavipes]|nr:transposable element Tcb2 transposase [Trichonephila clavipes]
MLRPEVVPFLQGIPGAIFQQYNARLHISNTVRDFCSAQNMHPLPCHDSSLDIWPIEHVWDLVGQRPLSTASKD